MVTKKKDCTLPESKNSKPTHIVASITYGGNCHFVFKKKLSDNEDKTNITGRLSITVTEGFTISGSGSLDIDNTEKKLTDSLSFNVYSDFLLKKQPTTFNETIKIYKDVSENFGSKKSLYNQSVPMFVTLVPIQNYCSGGSLTAQIGKDILKRATNIRITLLSVSDKISKLLATRAAVKNFLLRELLLGFQSDVSNYTLNYESKLERLIIGARNPKEQTIDDKKLDDLINKDSKDKYNYAKYLFEYLSERTRQVNALNIFYTQTILQDEPQIAVHTQADVPKALITEPVLFLLTLYVLPNVSTYNYAKWAAQNATTREIMADTRWYNNLPTVGGIGNLWRDFRMFFRLNGYKEGRNFFVLLKEEKSKKNPIDLELWNNGIETKKKFKLKDLLKLRTGPAVHRTPNGEKMTIKVKPLNNTGKEPNKITGILVSITSLFMPPFRQIYPITDKIITISNLVQEYTYNVAVSFNTEYGSLTPTTNTSIGTFDEMRKAVGCQITNDVMKKYITTKNQKNITGVTALECAHSCHQDLSCAYGWTFQLATGNCYFNMAKTNSTKMDGWAVGTQSCDTVNTLPDDNSNKVLFIDAYNVFNLPNFTQRDCSLFSYPGDEYGWGAASGIMEGHLMTCGGTNDPITTIGTAFNNCYSLENGKWVMKPNMTEERAYFGSSPYPKNIGGLLVTGASGNGEVYLKTTEYLLPGPGQTWKLGPELPIGLAYHCQATLGTTAIVTGGEGAEAIGYTTVYYIGKDSIAWKKLPDMTEGRYRHACPVLGNTLYVIGGPASPRVTTFKLGWAKWKPVKDVPEPMVYSKQSFAFEGKLYIITDSGNVYYLKDGSWEKVTQIKKTFDADNTDKQTFPAQILTTGSIGC